MLLDQSADTWGVPVRIISQPSGSWWTPIITLVIGLVFGVFLEPVKERILERSRRRRANCDLYDELGAYLARFVGFRLQEETRTKDSRFDIMLWQEVTRPYMPHFEYLSSREPAIFLRTDNPQGIQNLVQWLRIVGNTYRPPDAAPYAHPDSHVIGAFFADVIAGYNHFLDSKDSNRELITRAFNSHRETKTTPFPVAPKERNAT